MLCFLIANRQTCSLSELLEKFFLLIITQIRHFDIHTQDKFFFQSSCFCCSTTNILSLCFDMMSLSNRWAIISVFVIFLSLRLNRLFFQKITDLILYIIDIRKAYCKMLEGRLRDMDRMHFQSQETIFGRENLYLQEILLEYIMNLFE